MLKQFFSRFFEKYNSLYLKLHIDHVVLLTIESNVTKLYRRFKIKIHENFF